MPLCVYFLLPNNVWHTQLSKKNLGVLLLDHTEANGHVPLNRACNRKRVRPLRAGYRKRNIYCLGGNFKFSGYGKIPELLKFIFIIKTTFAARIENGFKETGKCIKFVSE